MFALNIKPLLLILFLTSLSLTLWGQKFLAFDSKTRVKRWKFYENDFISFELKNKQVFSGNITTLKDSSFWINDKEFMLSQIKNIKLRNHRYGLSILTKISTLAGVGYLTIDTGNRLINSNQPVIYEGSLLAGSIFISTAFIAKIFNRKTLRVKELRQIKIIDLSI